MAKFSAHHFPVGTTVLLNSDVAIFHRDYLKPHAPTIEDRTRTVNKLVQNGINSYIIDTGVTNTFSDGSVNKEFMNIDHVTDIVKRGQGPVVIEHPYMTKEHLKRLFDDRDMMAVGTSPQYGIRARKGYHTTGSALTVLMIEVFRIKPATEYYDQDRMLRDMLSQTWARRIKFGPILVWVINKKRMRQWLKVNMNRYLVNIKAETRAQQARDMEEDRFDDWLDHPLDLTPLNGGEREDFTEDRNLTLPQEFVTNFDLSRLDLYKKAVESWPTKSLFEVRNTDCDGKPIDGSLWYYGEQRDLSGFWDHFEKCRIEWLALQPSEF